MGILPDANNEHARELVLKSQAGKGPITLLHLVGAAVADVGAHILPDVVDPAIGMRPREFHTGIRAISIPGLRVNSRQTTTKFAC